MKKARRALPLLLIGLVVGLFATSVAVRLPEGDSSEPVADVLHMDAPTGRILVDLADDSGSDTRGRIAALLQGAIAPFGWPSDVAGPGDTGALGEMLSEEAQLYRLTPPESEFQDILRALRDDESVEAVEIERTWGLPEGAEAFMLSEGTSGALDDQDATPARGPFRPNDPYYKHQWHLDQIQMPDAWARTRGRGAVVAILDTGVLYRTEGRFVQVPDLANTRFVQGFDAIDRDGSPDDEHGHGTHVAGTVAQSTNNGVGVAGVAPEASIMPVRVLDARGSGGWGSLAAGIRYAADNGANVINMSLGGGMPSQVIRRAIEHAHEKGVVIVAAAGNASRSRVEYPGAYPHVIAVGAVRFDEELAFYSSYGRGLDIVAPGGDLRVDQNGDGMPDGVLQNTMVRTPDRHDYVAYQGTSMATPHVAGVAALLSASGITDPDAIERILTETAKSKGDTRRYASGLVQANDALRASHEGLGGLRGALSVLLGFGLIFGLRRRNALVPGLAPGLAPTLAIAAVVAGALSLLPLHWVPGLSLEGLAAGGVPGALASLGGPWLAPFALSALLPFGVAALLLGVRRASPIVVGTGIAFAAWLALEALVPTVHVALLPAWLVGPWLLVQAGLAALIARLAATRPR